MHMHMNTHAHTCTHKHTHVHTRISAFLLLLSCEFDHKVHGRSDMGRVPSEAADHEGKPKQKLMYILSCIKATARHTFIIWVYMYVYIILGQWCTYTGHILYMTILVRVTIVVHISFIALIIIIIVDCL